MSSAPDAWQLKILVMLIVVPVVVPVGVAVNK
jgi:hypothetical protein